MLPPDDQPDQDAAAVRRAYDAVAAAYAEQFAGELAHKPFDREALERLARETPPGAPVLDLGAGPGQTTAVLRAAGAAAFALDLSPAALREARRRQPGLPAAAADMLALPVADGAAAAVVAFYAIVHFRTAALARALGEMRRVLRAGGRALLAFHVGEGVVRVDGFLGHPVALDFVMHDPAAVAAALEAHGFDDVRVAVREPYAGVEHPTRRAYVWARAAG